MQIVGLTPIHLLSWCGTRMTHFLDVCVQIERVLKPLFDTIMSANIIPEKRDRYFTANDFFWLKILIGIQGAYCPTYLKKVNLSASLIFEVYTTAQTTAKTLMNGFFLLIYFDTNGNLCSENMVLNYQHRFPRG